MDTLKLGSRFVDTDRIMWEVRDTVGDNYEIVEIPPEPECVEQTEAEIYESVLYWVQE